LESINLCKKVTGKKFLDKNLEIKTVIKKSRFSEILGQNVTEYKVLGFKFLGLFSQNNMGASNKGTEIKSQKLKS